MDGHYDNLGKLQSSHNPDDGFIRVPEQVMFASPERIANLTVEQVVYVGPTTVVRDRVSGIMTIDTYDNAAPLPISELDLRCRPAIMRVVKSLGGSAIDLDGYLVDYRQVALHAWLERGLEDGIDSPTFERFQERFGIVFPLGAVFNVAGQAEYIGHPSLQESAEHMMRRIDSFIDSRWPMMPKLAYVVPEMSELENKQLTAATPNDAATIVPYVSQHPTEAPEDLPPASPGEAS